jgi:hypothetical protein
LKASRNVDPTITAEEIGMLGRNKITSLAGQIRSGRIESLPGLLLRWIPRAVTGALRDQVRAQLEARRNRRSELERQLAAIAAKMHANDPERWAYLEQNPTECRVCSGVGQWEVEGFRLWCACPAGEAAKRAAGETAEGAT